MQNFDLQTKPLLHLSLGHIFRFPFKYIHYEVIGFDNLYTICYYRKHTLSSRYEGFVYDKPINTQVIIVNK